MHVILPKKNFKLSKISEKALKKSNCKLNSLDGFLHLKNQINKENKTNYTITELLVFLSSLLS